MNAKDYQKYTQAVASFLERNGVMPGCHSPAEEQAEPFFSWRPCECCGSRLGGSREVYQFAMDPACPAFSTFTAEICTDCVYFLAYGELDDMTMLEVNRG